MFHKSKNGPVGIKNKLSEIRSAYYVVGGSYYSPPKEQLQIFINPVTTADTNIAPESSFHRQNLSIELVPINL